MFLIRKKTVLLRARATCSELPSNIDTMVLLVYSLLASGAHPPNFLNDKVKRSSELLAEILLVRVLRPLYSGHGTYTRW